MGLSLTSILNTFRRLRLKRAIARYRKSPGRRETLRLIRACLSLDRLREALELTTTARRRFPEDRAFVELHERARVGHASQLLGQARRALRAEGSPENFVRVTDLCRTLGDFDGALGHVRDGLARFPDHWAVQECAGKVHYYRFAATRDPSDSAASVRHLLQARSLNPTRYSTLVLLAVASLRAGDYDLAGSVVSELLAAYPDDPRASQLRQYVERARPAAAGSAPVRCSAEAQSGAGEADGGSALAYFVFDARGNLLDGQTRDDGSFEVEQSYDGIRDLLSACRFDTVPLGIGQLTSIAACWPRFQVVSKVQHDRSVAAFFGAEAALDRAVEETAAILEESLAT